jgi:hypothetical protein
MAEEIINIILMATDQIKNERISAKTVADVLKEGWFG